MQESSWMVWVQCLTCVMVAAAAQADDDRLQIAQAGHVVHHSVAGLQVVVGPANTM